MDFELSRPQKLLQKTVRDFLSRECPPERVRELMATEAAIDDALWEGLVDQGWTGLTVPEEQEGLGLGAIDLAAVAEVMGEHCLPGPFLSNHWAGAVLTAAHGRGAAVDDDLARLAEGELRATVALLEAGGSWDPSDVALEAVPEDGAEEGGWRLDGEKLFVPGAVGVDRILWVGRVEGELALFAVDAGSEGVSLEPMPAWDQTRKLHRLKLDGVRVPAAGLVARGEDAEIALALGTREATIAACAELVGGMQWVLATTLEYARNRQQFGKPIGIFQAVQHHLANILLHLESARSATYYAAWAVSVGEEDADHTVSIAKAYCSDAAREVGNAGIQVHGGIGFTWEHDLQLYYKRAQANELLFGDATYHRERIARKVIDA